MAQDFKEIQPESLRDNVFTLIGADWMLVTAGTPESYNTMTASWGGMGVLWDKHVCFCFIRPTRHTHVFMEGSKFFTLSFFEEKYRSALNYCGSHSGRDVDKARETGITPVKGKTGAVYFDEARLVVECEKIYFQDLVPAHFLSPDIERNYPNKDYHRMYIGKIVRCAIR
jgi:flavin reductase (DIM6/NTAB) family NADH-FMN oxidoreductase RutF